MIEINLLPKELRRRKKVFALTKNTLYFLFGCAGVFVILIFLTILQQGKLKSLEHKISEAKKRKSQLKETIQLVDALGEIKKKILDRMSAIESLDKNRSTWIEIMEDLSLRVPENVWLSSFKETSPPPSSSKPPQDDTLKQKPSFSPPNSKVTIEGYAFSINNLATFLTRLLKSNYFRNPELAFVKAVEVEKQKVFIFQLNSELLYSSQVVQYMEKEKSFAQKEEE